MAWDKHRRLPVFRVHLFWPFLQDAGW